nr:nucleolar pre-ribosomal-associated protein 1 isoform X1 [Anolis sagrei ordinatus]
MGAKRKSPAAAQRDQEPPQKQRRDNEAAKEEKQEEELTGARLKALLRSPSAAIKGLETFVSLAKCLPSGERYDVVEGYVKVSVECAEILKLLDGERRPESEMLLIFQALEIILLRTASDLSHFHVVGMNIVKKMLNKYMKLIYAALYSEGHRLSRLCLTLLSAMVTQGPDAARDVYTHFDFNNKFLPSLVKKRDYKGKPDVRMAYIQYALSFFIAGDNTILVNVLELKDFIPDIFRTGLKEDRISTISLLLSTLASKVVQNKNISKTQKVRFFTAEVLSHIASLYRWNGIADVNTEDVKASQDPEEAGKVVVRELVHNFLMDLCCSLKHGINFYDPSLGTSGRGGNLVLLRFLLSLKTAVEDEMVADLVMNIFKVCPDLLNRYFKESQYSFVPRLKSAWLDNMKLLRKIYEAQPEISNAFKTTEFIPLPRLLSMVMVTTIPAVCNKAMFTQGLNIASKTVKHTIFSILSVVLKRALKNMEYCLNEKIWEKSEIYTPSVMQEFVQQYREALSKLLPDMTNIVAVWQSLLKQEREQGGLKGTAEDASFIVEEMAEVKETNGEHGSDDAETTLLKAVLLHVICLYQQVVPHLIAQSNFDFSKLIKGIVTEKGLRHEIPPVLQHHILMVALELPANKFSWFKMQEETDKVCGERSVFYLLLKMFVTSNHLQLKASTKKLIIKVLRDSGVFEYTWKELELWLEHLENTVDSKKEAVIQFLEKILVKLVTNPYPYTDKAADLVQEASVFQVNLFKQDIDNISIPISHIDDVLDMIDVLVEGNEDFNEEIGTSLNKDMIVNTFPFSAIVPASLETRNKLLLENDENRGESIVEYLIAVFTDLLHSQRDPLALCLMFQLYDKGLHSVCPKLFEFSNYYSLWIPQEAKEALLQQARSECVAEVLSSSSSFSSLLKNTYQKGVALLLEEDITEKLNEAISKLQTQQLLLACKHVLLYLKTTVENFSSFDKKSGLSLLTLFVDLLKKLLHKGDETESCNQQEQKPTQTESDLFVDADFLMPAETGNNKILEELLSVVFKNPLLENWFLAVEKHSVPPHNLNPLKVKLLSARLNCGILELLQMGSSFLQSSDQLDVLSKYFNTITKTVLEELHTVSKKGSQVRLRRSLQMEALQELHTYMDTPQLKEVVLAMLQLPKENLVKKKSETVPEKEMYLSSYGEVLIQLLMESYQRGSLKEDQFLSREHIVGMGLLLTTAVTEELEKVFLYVIQKESVFSQAVGVNVLLFCLNRYTETSLAIAALLIQNCQTHLLQFELWCLKRGTGKLLKKNVGLFLPLVSIYLDCQEQRCFIRLSKVSSAVTTVLRDILWPELLGIVLNMSSTSEPIAEECHVLSKLLPSSKTDTFITLMEKLPAVLEKEKSHEHWVIADAVSRALESSAEKLNSWKKHLLTACIKWLIVAYSNNKTHETCSEIENSMLSRLEKLLNSTTEVAPEDWHSFVKMGLKHRYKDRAFLKTLNGAINLLYKEEVSLSQKLVKLSVLYMMITQHSLFLSIMLRAQEEDDTNVHSKEALVDILLTLVKCCPAVCESGHFSVLLGAYGATLSILDQKILLLLKLYEKNGLSLVNFRVQLLWGPAAVEHHKACKILGKSLWQQPSMEEILCLLDREMMMRTILNFPQHRHLLALEEEPELISKGKNYISLKDLYDPCFLLQLFSELLRPECVVACQKFVDVNALGLVVAALSSYDPNMRAAAYYVLNAFRSHLEGARFREQKQLLYLMDVVQNGIRQPNLKFTFPLTLYISRVAQQMLNPEEHMYTKLNKFLLSHQFLDLKKVPGFFQLFYSFDLEHKMEREWSLAIISEGLRDKHCYELYDYQRIFHVILSFFHSPLCDEATQYQILQILQNAAYITKAAYTLIRDHSLLTWILSVLEKRFLENKVLNQIISLVHNLWVTNLGDKLKALGLPHNKEQLVNQKFLPLQFISEFLHILITLLKHIRASLDFPNLIQFFSTLSSVLQYRALVIEAFREMGRFTVNKHVLSNKDVLLLLHKWSIIGKNLELQDNLQLIAQQYQIKDLLRNIKEKKKPEMPFRTSLRLPQKNDIIETETALDRKQLHLDDCRSVLRSVLVHWEPVFLDTPEKYSEEQNGYSNPDLTYKIAYLVFNWLVKSNIDSTLNVQDVLLTFKWLKKSVLQNSTVVEMILKDGILRNCIFKIYNSIWKGNEDKTVELSDLSLLNDIMLQLLDSPELNKGDFHEIMKKFYLSAMTKEDTMKKAAGMFLTSVYIGDCWLGAEQPDMFINHIKLIHEATASKQNKDQEIWECEEPVVSLCKDLYSLPIFQS